MIEVATVTDILIVFLLWIIVWLPILHLPPGSKSIEATFRLHFIHGVISTLLAFGYIFGYIQDYYATMATTAYFVVDLCNMFLNDFYFKVATFKFSLALFKHFFIFLYTM